MSAASASEQAKTLIAAAKIEQQQLQQLKAQLDQYLKAHGLQNQVQTTISRRGLVVRVLTDKVLFDSGQATLKPAGLPLLGEVANLLNVATNHQIAVEGHTDSVPISSAQYPSNWELSTARATTVVRYFISRSVDREPADRFRLRRSPSPCEQRDRPRPAIEPARRDRPVAEHTPNPRLIT